jgi:ABC-type Fe3+-hydroxamate transport system substrate-binding protein
LLAWPRAIQQIATPTTSAPIAVDATGRLIYLRYPAQRIVCLGSSGLECLVELGLKPVGYLTHEGDSHSYLYGEQTQMLNYIGSRLLPNLGAIRQLQPDLILGQLFSHRYHPLRYIAPTYLMAEYGDAPTFTQLQDIGLLTGWPVRAQAAIQGLLTRLQTYRNCLGAISKKKVVLIKGLRRHLRSYHLIIETPTGVVGNLLQGLVNFPWPQTTGELLEPHLGTISLFQLYEANPDVIFIQTHPTTSNPFGYSITQQVLWQNLKAVRMGQVYQLKQPWPTGNSTRMLQLLLHQVLSQAYPDRGLEQLDRADGVGLRQRQLCQRLGLDYKTVAQTAKRQGVSTHAYLQDQTAWILDHELYYPPPIKL